MKTTISDLSSNYEEFLRIPGLGKKGKTAKGFIIGTRGKTLFWYIDPTFNGAFRCYPTDEAGNIYQPRYFWPSQVITIIY